MEKIITSEKAMTAAEKIMKDTMGSDIQEIASKVGINVHDKINEDQIGEAFDKFGEMMSKNEKIGGKSVIDIIKEQNNKYSRDINDVFKGMNQGDIQRLGKQLKKGGIGNLEDHLMRRGRTMQRGGDRKIKRETFTKIQDVKKKEKQLMGVFINKSRKLKPYKYYPSTAKEEAEVKINSFNVTSISPSFLRVDEFKDEILTIYYTMDKKPNKVLSKLSGIDLGGCGCIILEGKDLTVEQVNKLLKTIDENPVPVEMTNSKVERNKKKRAKRLAKKKSQKEEGSEGLLPDDIKNDKIPKIFSQMFDTINPKLTELRENQNEGEIDKTLLFDTFKSIIGEMVDMTKDIKEDKKDEDIINAIGGDDPECEELNNGDQFKCLVDDFVYSTFHQSETCDLIPKKEFKFTKKEQEKILIEYENSTDDTDKGKYADSLLYGLSESRLKEFTDFISKEGLMTDKYQDIIDIINMKKSQDNKDDYLIDQI